MTQAGDSVLNFRELLVGERGFGSYTMESGTINARGAIILGLFETARGTFTHRGGTITSNGAVFVGWRAPAPTRSPAGRLPPMTTSSAPTRPATTR